jgi:Arc/MetJ family transcription regulator
MRTNIEIDDEIMGEAQRLIGAHSKKETVDTALRELVARHRRLGVLELRGKVHWAGDLGQSRRGR